MFKSLRCSTDRLCLKAPLDKSSLRLGALSPLAALLNLELNRFSNWFKKIQQTALLVTTSTRPTSSIPRMLFNSTKSFN